jgi:hypothetical protein
MKTRKFNNSYKGITLSSLADVKNMLSLPGTHCFRAKYILKELTIQRITEKTDQHGITESGGRLSIYSAPDSKYVGIDTMSIEGNEVRRHNDEIIATGRKDKCEYSGQTEGKTEDIRKHNRMIIDRINSGDGLTTLSFKCGGYIYINTNMRMILIRANPLNLLIELVPT